MDPPQKSVCIVGAGFSGLCTAIKLQERFPHYDFTIFDCNPDFGGTWIANTYPGCSCDIPSHLYSLSFEPNPSWTSQYPSQPEILAYMKRVAEKRDLYVKAKFRHQVEKLEWLEERMKWKACVVEMMESRQHIQYFDFVFCGTGEYHLPKIPPIFQGFQGPSMHSAEWNSAVGLEGKRVAVVGSGASAIQIIPEIAPVVGKLLSYQRTPAWVIGKRQWPIPQCVRWAFSHIPGLQKVYRTSLYLTHEIQYPAFQITGILSRIARPIAILLGRVQLFRQVRCGELRRNLLPAYNFGCNRVCLSSDYYPALCRDNVRVIRDDITEVTPDAILTKQGEEQIDVLILATGFEIHEYFGPLKIVGRKGENMLRKWKVDGPSIYLNILSHQMPNLAFIHGPGVDVGHNTGLFTIECQVNWVLEMMSEMEKRGASGVAVKRDVEEAYMARHKRDMKNTIWSTNDCGSFYANGQGLVTIVYPRSQIDYWLRTRRFDAAKLEFYMAGKS